MKANRNRTIPKELYKNELTCLDRKNLELNYQIELEENITAEDNIFIKINKLKEYLNELEAYCYDEFKDFGNYSISGFIDSTLDCIDTEQNKVLKTQLEIIKVEVLS